MTKEPEINFGRLPGGGFWAGFCSNPNCDVLGCPGDCTPPDPEPDPELPPRKDPE